MGLDQFATRSSTSSNKARYSWWPSSARWGVLPCIFFLFLTFSGGRVAQAAWYDTYDFTADGVVGFWPFDGNANDYSGHHYDGTLNGGVSSTSGRFGQGYQFDGTTGYVSVEPPPLLNQELSAFSMSLWVKTTATSGYAVNKYSYSSEQQFMGKIGSNGATVFQIYDDGNTNQGRVESAQAVNDGAFHSLTYVFDGVNVSVYVDGVFSASSPRQAAAPLNAGNAPLWFGAGQSDDLGSARFFFTGVIDDVAIFNRVLTPTEAACLARDNNGNGIADYWEALIPPQDGPFLWNGSFSTGDLSGWEVAQGSGVWGGGSCSGAGENVLQSRRFALTKRMTFVITGDYDATNYPNRVELVDGSGEVLLTATPQQGTNYTELRAADAEPSYSVKVIDWDTSSWVGHTAYLRLCQFNSHPLSANRFYVYGSPNLPRYDMAYPGWIQNGNFQAAPNPTAWTAPGWNQTAGATWCVKPSENGGNYVTPHGAFSDLLGDAAAGTIESFAFYASALTVSLQLKGTPGCPSNRVEVVDAKTSEVLASAIPTDSSSWQSIQLNPGRSGVHKIRVIDAGTGWIAVDEISGSGSYPLVSDAGDNVEPYDTFRRGFIDWGLWEWTSTPQQYGGWKSLTRYYVGDGKLRVFAFAEYHLSQSAAASLRSRSIASDYDYIEFNVEATAHCGGSVGLSIGGQTILTLASVIQGSTHDTSLRANFKIIRVGDTNSFDVFYGNRYVNTISPSNLNIALSSSAPADNGYPTAEIALMNLRLMRSREQRFVGTAILTGSYCGDPVHTNNGNFSHQEEDLAIPALGFPLSLLRTYNSADADRMGGFGRRWSSNLDCRVEEAGDHAYVIGPDGQADSYSVAGEGFTPDGDTKDQLERLSSGFRVSRRDGAIWVYGYDGRVSQMSDKNGNTLTYQYDGNGRVTRVADSTGRRITLERDGSGLVTSAGDPLGRTIRYEYDAFARLVRVTDPEGGVTQYLYDDNHRMTGIINPKGERTLTNVYDAQGRVIEQRDALNALTTFSYDDVNRKTTVTNPRLYSKEYSYTQDGWVSQIHDEKGNDLRYEYDLRGNRTRITDRKGKVVLFSRDSNGNMAGVTDQLSQASSVAYDPTTQNPTERRDRENRGTGFTYDAQGNMTRAADALSNHEDLTYTAQGLINQYADKKGHATKVEYNAYGQPVKIILPTSDDHFTSMTYDVSGRLTAVSDPNRHTTRYEYDGLDHITRTQLPDGTTRLFEYDAAGRLTATIDGEGARHEFEYNAKGKRTLERDALGHETRYGYDANGNVVSVTQPLGRVTGYEYDERDQLSAVVDPNGNRTEFQFDANGNLTEVHNPDGSVERNIYDDANRLTAQVDGRGNTTNFEYDADGVMVAEVDPLGSRSDYTYDNAGRLTREQYPDGRFTQYVVDANGNVTSRIDALSNDDHREHDAANRLTRLTDRRGNATQYFYDPAGNLIQEQNAAGKNTWYTHDALNRLIAVRDHLGNTTTRTLDGNGRIRGITTPMGHQHSLTYNAEGWKTRETDANTHSTYYEYDDLGRVTTVRDDAGTSTSYSYDPVGNITEIRGRLGSLTHFTYDTMNRVITKADGQGNTHHYSYDENGNLTQHVDARGVITIHTYTLRDQVSHVQYGDGSTKDYVYDANGNLLSVADSTSAGTVSYVYDALNRVTAYHDPFGRQIGYAYDEEGNLATLTYASGHQVHYTYDLVNRLHTVTDWNGATVTYDYDDAGRLASQTNSNGTRTTYAYDNDSRLSTLVNEKVGESPFASYAIVRDAKGNITKITANAPKPSAFRPENETYTNDSENRLTARGSATYEYDANGNTVRIQEGATNQVLTFDARDKLVQMTGLPEGDAAFVYDALGNRIERRIGGDTVRYLVDPTGEMSNVLAEYDAGGTLVAEYVYGSSLALCAKGSQSLSYHYDMSGNTVALTGTTGTVTNSYAYDEYGRVIAKDEYVGQPFRYVGSYGVVADGTDLYCMRARYYDAVTGRFTSQDPLLAMNLYQYSNNNPLVYSDPDGRIVCTIIGAVGGAIVGAGSGIIATALTGGNAAEMWGNIAAGAVGGVFVGGTLGALADSSYTFGATLAIPALVLAGAEGGMFGTFAKGATQGLLERAGWEPTHRPTGDDLVANTLVGGLTAPVSVPGGPMIKGVAMVGKQTGVKVAQNEARQYASEQNTDLSAYPLQTGAPIQAIQKTPIEGYYTYEMDRTAKGSTRYVKVFKEGKAPTKRKAPPPRPPEFTVAGVNMFVAQLTESLLNRWQKYTIFSNGPNTPIIPEVVTERAVGGAYQTYEK